MAHIASIEQAREERMFGGIARFRSGAFPLDQLRAECSGVNPNGSRWKPVKVDGKRQCKPDQLLEFRAGRGCAPSRALSPATGLFLGLLGGVAMTLLFARGITSRIAGCNATWRGWPGGAPDRLAGRDEIGALNQGLIRVAEMLRRKGVALENALHGIAEVDRDGGYLWVNKTYAEMAASSSQATRRPRLCHGAARGPGESGGSHRADANEWAS